jgi:hypothetical protein
MKILDMKNDSVGKGLMLKEWAVGLENTGMEKVLLKYDAVIRAIKFVGVTSLSDALTKEAVYAGIIFLRTVWLEETLGDMEVGIDTFFGIRC